MKRLALVVAALLLLTVGAVRPEAQASVAAQINNFWNLLKAGSTDPTTQITYAFTNEALVSNGYISWGSTRGTTGYGIRDNNGTIQIKNNGGAWATPSGGADPLGTYLVKTATNAPANAQIMAALGTGITINTTTTGVQSIYAGTSCTNQFPRSLNASGAATCATVALGTDVSGTLLAADFPILTGDITTPGGSLATTLAATGVGAGSVGSATAIPVITFDAKGRATVKTTATPQLTLTSTYLSSLDASTLTGYTAANLAGTIAAANFPALTGDVTNTAGSLATTVGKIGGNAIALGGAFTITGAFSTTLTVTGATALTLPTSGTVVTTSVTSLPSLATVGTIGTGVWQGTVVAGLYGGTGVANSGKTITLGGNFATSGAFNTTLTVTGGTNVTLPTTGTLVTSAVTTLSSLTSVGTIGTGVWQGTVVGATYGGTGVNNGASTITLGGSFTTSGAFTTTLTVTGGTNVTLPTTGTLVNTAVTSLASLATVGTVTGGTWNATAVTVPYGGCGQTSFTAYAVITGGTTSTGNCQQVAGVGTAGQVLTSGGAGVLPTWTSSGAGTVTNTTGNLTANQMVIGNGASDVKVLGALGTTTQVLHGNAGGAPTFGSVSLTADVTNTLPVGNGGLGITSGTSGGVLYFSAVATLASSGALTNNDIVLGGGAGSAPKNLGTQSANCLIAGPTTGSAAIVTCRALDPLDLAPHYVSTTTQFDKTGSTAFSDITGLTFTLVAGKTYQFRGVLFVTADVTGGHKVQLSGTATVTTINGSVVNFADNVAVRQAHYTGLSQPGAFATGVAYNTVMIEGTFIVNAGGTLTVQFAQNSASGTSSVLPGSWMSIN